VGMTSNIIVPQGFVNDLPHEILDI